MQDRAARQRTGLHGQDRRPDSHTDTRVHVTLPHLRFLESKARSLRFLPKQPAASVLNGRHASRLRGRGLNFEELRGYLPGDDPRTIDWKVTARTGEPHIRVYSEERDRPVLLVVDQRMSMFFGTKHAMKSVTAAEAAALAAFRILDQGDRVGGIIFGDDYAADLKPKAGRAARDRFLMALVRANRSLSAGAPTTETPMGLNVPLSKVVQIARRDHLILIISDFDGINERTERIIRNLARHNDVVLCPVTDPLSHEVPDNMKVVISDGTLQVELDTRSGEVRQRLSDYTTGRLAKVFEWQKRFGLPVLPLSSGEDTVPQMRRFTGLSPRASGGGR